MGGATIAHGDIILGDADAILVLAAKDLPAALAAAETRTEHEAVIMDRLRLGETTLEILGLGEAGQ
jgi:4-hydroxy-4-methyl-2-oxoglutarate aldolase